MTPDELIGPELGPLSVDGLRTTAERYAGIGADDDLSESVRFRLNVARLIRERAAQIGGFTGKNKLCIFLLEPLPPAEAASSRVPMLSDGLAPLDGYVWFVSAAANSGHRVRLPANKGDEAVRFISESLNMGDRLAVVFNPRVTPLRLRFYRSGLNDLDDCMIHDIETSDITLERISEVVDIAYKTRLRTPDAQSASAKLWTRPSKWWPSEKAEQRIQLYLKDYLQGQFLTCTVREEQPTGVGRFDIEITEVDRLRNQVFSHAVIELKVLRSFGETGASYTDTETLSWVESGVDQAYVYGLEKGMRFSALYCFDMREQDHGLSCFDHVREKANRLQVPLGKWYIYASSRLFRKAAAS